MFRSEAADIKNRKKKWDEKDGGRLNVIPQKSAKNWLKKGCFVTMIMCSCLEIGSIGRGTFLHWVKLCCGSDQFSQRYE